MKIEFDYGKEMEKLEKEKLEWEKYKKEEEARLDQEKEILLNFKNSYENEKLYNLNKIKKAKDDIIKELQAEKYEYENKIKDLDLQINLIQEDRELFNNYKNESEKRLNMQLKDILTKKAETENIKKVIDEEYNKIEKRELNYLSGIEKLENKKKIINELMDKVKQKEIENKQRAKNIINDTSNFDIKKNEIEINKKKFEEKLNEVIIERELLGKEKKIVEAKKNDLLLKLESVNLVGMKLYGNKFGEENEINN